MQIGWRRFRKQGSDLTQPVYIKLCNFIYPILVSFLLIICLAFQAVICFSRSQVRLSIPILLLYSPPLTAAPVLTSSHCCSCTHLLSLLLLYSPPLTAAPVLTSSHCCSCTHLLSLLFLYSPPLTAAPVLTSSHCCSCTHLLSLLLLYSPPLTAAPVLTSSHCCSCTHLLSLLQLFVDNINGSFVSYCTDHVFTSEVIPDMLILMAYLYGLYLIRISLSEQLHNVMERTFLSFIHVPGGHEKIGRVVIMQT